jgi:F1F0 ATPase subunit 2
MRRVMIELLPLLFALIAGLLLGLVFFGGLWWTVQKALSSAHPGLWFISSFLLRTGIAVTGFYFISAGNLQKLALLVIGFLISRLLVTYFTRQKPVQ